MRNIEMRCDFRFTGTRVSFSVILLAMAFAMVTPLKAENPLQPLWQIGQKDSNFAEFALADTGDNGQYLSRFPQDVDFVIGKDIPSESWSYIHPGPADAWAGSREHPFTVAFDLSEGSYEVLRLDLNVVGTHDQGPTLFNIVLNDGEVVALQTKHGAGDKALTNPSVGNHSTYNVWIPASRLKKSGNKLTITSVDGSWTLYDSLSLYGFEKFPEAKAVTAEVGRGIRKVNETEGRLFVINTRDGFLSGKLNITATCEGKEYTTEIVPEKTFTDSFELLLPIPNPSNDSQVEITVKSGDKEFSCSATVKPERNWQIHLIHQTHLDIGYTHTQEEVLDMQVNNIKNALKEIKRSASYPEEARFKFHPEGMWAVEEFFRTATAQEKKEFLIAARRGDIHMDALYAQAMTGIYTEEELMELMTSAKLFEKKYGIKVDSAIQSDVPGYTWGLATVLAKHGVKYFSGAPNSSHRIGHVFEWADQPFYWVSPSGKEKILFWVPGKGYSWFQWGAIGKYDVEDNRLMIRMNKGEILGYLDGLDNEGYPYDMVQLRYSIGSDNGPPDKNLSHVVKEWNEKYISPKLIISRNSQMFKEFEKRYGQSIPVVKGDYTPYWEDGCASTSLATSINRRACEKLQQTQTLWSMVSPAKKLHEKTDQAWQKMIMYDEHTWGAWNSISAPESEFVLTQERYKKQFAVDGARMTDDIAATVLAGCTRAGSSAIDVYNTTSWDRSDLVILDQDQSAAGDMVKDQAGNPVPSQRLASGELALVVNNVPAFGVRRYTIHSGQAHKTGTARANESGITNKLIKLTIDSKTGAINSLYHNKLNKELVDRSKGTGINDYLQIIGRDDKKGHQRISGNAKITIEDPGPLVATLKIETTAPGCKKLTRRVRVFSGSDKVELINTIDKVKEARPEGIYFGYPLNVPDGIAKIDVPWAVIQPEKDQMKGANKNYYCVQRWMDISNNDYGITWVTVDAPMLQFDPIKIVATGWDNWAFRTFINPGQEFHSWVMNNHWETNYKAYQQGVFTFRYVLKPHAGGYNAVKAQRTGREVCQPLLAVNADSSCNAIDPLMKVNNDNIIITSVRPSRDGKALMVRLFNTTDEVQKVELEWGREIAKTWLSNPMEDAIEKAAKEISLVKFEVITLRVDQELDAGQ